MVRRRTSQDVVCHQDTNSVEQVADATEEFLWLEREAKEAREDTGLKELVIQTLVVRLILVKGQSNCSDAAERTVCCFYVRQRTPGASRKG